MNRRVNLLPLASAVTFLGASLALSGLRQAAAAGSFSSTTVAGAPTLPPSVRAALDTVSAAGIRAHVRFLSDELLQGRETGTTGGLLAARYLAAQFEQYGLKPVGDGGTFYQEVSLFRPRLDLDRSSLVLERDGHKVTLNPGKEFVLTSVQPSSAHLDVPLVFVGFGITAPEYDYDDYRGLDVKGKIAVLLRGQPSRAGDAQFFTGGKDAKYEPAADRIVRARAHGAVGVILVVTGDRGARLRWDVLARMQTAGQISLAPETPESFSTLVMRSEGAARLFEGAATSWKDVEQAGEAGTAIPFALAERARLTLEVDPGALTSPNVVGMVEGSDPELKQQVVILSAHFDHLGLRTTPAGREQVYPGAWDNASGDAEVLEMARVCAGLRPAPRRSMLFLLFTGEEEGLLGSRFYTQHPVVPIEQTAADINLDMTEIFGIPRELVAQGAEHSTLLKDAEVTAAELGMRTGPDPTPELGVFTRSDQYSFARAGVPCVFIRWANEYEDIAADAARARAKQLLDTIYHKTADKFDPSWSWEGMRRNAQSSLLLGLNVAGDPAMPSWNRGDSFNRPRAKPGGEQH